MLVDSNVIVALLPFSKLGKPEQNTPAFHDLGDDVVIYNDGNGECITAGDIRLAVEVVQKYTVTLRDIN